MKVYFATDHAGYALKNILLAFVRDELGYDVEDCGAYEQVEGDDYVTPVRTAAQEVSNNPTETRAIILGGSGQGEAMCANRFPHVRAGVYYGGSHTQTDSEGSVIDVITSLRTHNNANVLSLAARFITNEEALGAVRAFLETKFDPQSRHRERIEKLG